MVHTFRLSLSSKALVLLHSVVHVKGDTSSFAENENELTKTEVQILPTLTRPYDYFFQITQTIWHTLCLKHTEAFT